MGIREETVLAQMKSQSKIPAVGGLKKRIQEDSGPLKKNKTSITDLQLLNLLVHFPDTIPRLQECGCRALISDPEIDDIVRTIFDRYLQKGIFSPEDLLENLENESGRERLRETLHRPFIIYSAQDAEQALSEFEKRAYQKKISASFKEAKGDRETQNKLLKLKIQGPFRS
jgi:hypothetical protein